MIKSGLIVGAILFLLVLIAASVISPLCAFCLPIFAGLGAGYLTGVFDKPAPEDVVKRGAIAGTIAGGIAIFAQVLAAVINSLVLQSTGFNPAAIFGGEAIDPMTIWVGQFFAAFCVGLLNVGLMAGFGALGGLLWRNQAARQQPA
jgi:hypothetical protein